jgi:hypothetical protein
MLNGIVGLTGKTVCLGLSHSRKKCAAEYEVITANDPMISSKRETLTAR